MVIWVWASLRVWRLGVSGGGSVGIGAVFVSGSVCILGVQYRGEGVLITVIVYYTPQPYSNY